MPQRASSDMMAAESGQKSTHPMSQKIQYQPLPLIAVSGDNTACGITAGQLSSSRVSHSLATYKRTFELCNINWSEAIKKASVHIHVIKEYAPHLLSEMEGLAQGSSVEADSLLALNCRTEILPPNFLQHAMASAGHTGDVHANECTSLAFARDKSPVWLAQNWDWVSLQRDALIVLHAKPENAPAYITVTEAGMLAKIGINEHGLGVSLNILRSNNDGQSEGMPVHFLLRALLECSTVDEAINFAQQLPFASSSNIMIADKNGHIASLEISPAGCKVLPPSDGQLCHTNHFLNEDFAANDAGLAGNISTVNRLETAQRHLSAIQDLSDIKNLLSDTSDGLESICRFANDSLPEIAQIETVVAVAMNLTEKTLWVSAAQPSITDFTQHKLN